MNARKYALDILIDIEENQAFSNIAIHRHLKGKPIDGRDRRFITELVYGVMENKIYLDYIIQQFSKIKGDKISIPVMNILRLGLYQITYLDKVPPSAAVNESVNLAKKIQWKAAGFVNGMLRNYLRNKNDIKLPSYEENPREYMSLAYSHPLWLVEKWQKEFGNDFTRQLLQANNQTPKLTVRTNTLKITKEELMEELKRQHVEVSHGLYVEEALCLCHTENIEELKSFQKGYFQIQDESSMLAAHVLDPQPNDIIIDVCAAPGGKTTHMAQLMKNKGRIIARDIYEHKLKLIQNTARRLGISIIETQCFNGKEVDETLVDKADRVLVDAPCSGLGIIRRKPEIKYNKGPDDFHEISNLQLRILENAGKYVKKGGFLVYSTCTISREENIGVIEKFISRNRNFAIIDMNPLIPEVLRSSEKYLQLYPHLHDVDGFFICKLRKNGA
ncbi:16S rRNA (cytosine(967)-C(5))-methyltransferase RsmB [Thermotalea metallivorans]|uniref:16S rRNA (cytosine(967)-C(5))-methyltransferase n=1 Tax=Thermotalea metallivorans TaxID=520762 RepID=A0A140L612_9FIRM|nr:16S rRNA (cytosine(967)-C(5))-methyltransferase RsmB [Thermotalea metallivorans]KXG75987.1 Ribosomal RNA small subunit methyltransferase B [Thermotalea metallivorans]